MSTYKKIMLLVDKVSAPLKKIQKSTEKVTQVTDKLTKRHSALQQGLRNTEAKLIHLDRRLRDMSNQMEKFSKRTEHISKLGDKLKDIGKGLTVGVTLPVIAMGGAMVKLASDMEETLNKVDVSFGNSSDKVKEWAKSSITSMGLAQQSALDSAALYGDMATGMGMAQDKAADMAMSLTQLGADLASFKNISNEMAQTALKSIFTGETESLKNLGIVMTENNLTRFAASRGIRKQMKDMSDLEKIQLRYNYVMSQTVNAQGDFIRTGGGAANQTRMFQEQLKEIGVTFGQYILPYFTKAIMKLNEMLKAFSNLSPQAQKTILVISAIAAAIGPLITLIGGMITTIAKLNTAIMWLAANPIVLIIAAWTAAIVGIITVIVLLVKHWDKVKETVGNVCSAIANWWGRLVNQFKGWIGQLLEWLNALIDKLGAVAYLIPGLGAVKLAKDVAGAISNNRTNNDNRSYQSNSNNTTSNTYNTTNNYNSIMPLSSAQYSTGI